MNNGTNKSTLSMDSAETVRGTLLSPLRSRQFTMLWMGQTFSQFGDAILWVTIPLAVYSMGRSTLQMGLVMALLILPQVVLLPFTGLLVDRASRSLLMMTTDISRGLLVAVIAVLAGTHRLTMPLLYAFVLLYGVMDSLFQPAYSAARSQIFTPDVRNAANGLTQVSQQVAKLLGPAAGGLIVGLASLAVGFWVDAATFLISIVSLAFLRLDSPERISNREASGLRHFAHELTGGYQELRKHQWLWVGIIAAAFINIASSGVTTILLPWLIKVHLGMSDAVYGLIASTSGLGGILCALVYGRRQRWRKRGLVNYGSMLGIGMARLVLIFARTPLVLMAISAAYGACLMIMSLTWQGSLQELVAPEAFGRVASLDMFGSFALLPVGSLFTGWLAIKIGGIKTIIVSALLIILGATTLLCLPKIRHFD
ncbi:MFS transporter [Desulfosporosinus sp. PR]|uniref:MFS transporter n=1 Tax=Candidatus Desulfosporosinus nitrosoreducens TaxID=3401928 RepID=UPI0027F6F0AE|nr:MFS transporter [Desulfosporosinus sp. PR]MDQ7096730.1 MFS transporter [Desulfosporosinus sp. PR]